MERASRIRRVNQLPKCFGSWGEIPQQPHPPAPLPRPPGGFEGVKQAGVQTGLQPSLAVEEPEPSHVALRFSPPDGIAHRGLSG